MRAPAAPSRASAAGALIEAQAGPGSSSCSPATTSGVRRPRRWSGWPSTRASRRAACLAVDVEAHRLSVLGARVSAWARPRSRASTSTTAPIRWWRPPSAAARDLRRDRARAPAPSPSGRARRSWPSPMYGRMGREDVPRPGLLVVEPARESTASVAAWVGARAGPPRWSALGAHPRRGRRRSGAAGASALLLDAVPDPILLTDPEGRMLVANARAKALLVGQRGRERRPPPGGGPQQHALLVRAGPERDPGARAAARAAAGRPRRRAPTCCSSCSAPPLPDTREGTALVSILRNVSDLRRATRGDRGELPPAAHRRGGRAGGARPPRPHHRLRGRPHPGHRPRGRAGA